MNLIAVVLKKLKGLQIPVPPGISEPQTAFFEDESMEVITSLMFGESPTTLRIMQLDADANLKVVQGEVTTPVDVTHTKLVKTVSVAGTAVPIVVASTYARVLELQARLVAGDNTGNIFFGLSDLDKGVAELFELTPGDSIRIAVEKGERIDLANYYIDADNNSDGVVGWYY